MLKKKLINECEGDMISREEQEKRKCDAIDSLHIDNQLHQLFLDQNFIAYREEKEAKDAKN